jgi:hypothetical protein
VLTEALAALAAAGGTALVGAMATDAWQTARSGVAKLFGRGGAGRRTAIEAQLDGNAVLVERASDRDEARRALVPLWQMELHRLLEDRPEVESELRNLLAHVQNALPAEQRRWVLQTNVARDAATVYAVQDGKQEIHYHGSASPMESLDTTDDGDGR